MAITDVNRTALTPTIALRQETNNVIAEKAPFLNRVRIGRNATPTTPLADSSTLATSGLEQIHRQC